MPSTGWTSHCFLMIGRQPLSTTVLVAVERLSDNQWFDGTQWQPF